jgi:putative nucleotidyltransferase with HDIG domain
MASKVKILYVEDNPENVQLVRRILETKGYSIIEAANGLAGVETAKKERPDLILMDINLPDMDGYAAATLIKNTMELSHIPIVALTANVMKGDRERSITAGCDGYISKPIDVKKFPDQVAAYIQGEREKVAPEEEKAYLKEHSVKLVEKLEERIRELIAANEERQRNLDKLQDRTHELSLMLEITTTVTSSLDLQEVLRASAKIIAENLGTTFCRTVVLDQLQQHLALIAVYPQRKLEWDQMLGRHCPLREARCFQTLQEISQPLLLNQEEIIAADWTPQERALLTGNLVGLKFLLICPVLNQGVLIGLVVLGEARDWSRSPFTAEKIRLCQAVANQMGSAIKNAKLYEEVVFKGLQLKAANLDSIKALAEALETKDVETKGHSDRTMAHAANIAKWIGLSEQEQEWIQFAAILHDIGKIGIPEQILKKPGKLTNEEYEIMKRHPVYGAQIVQEIKFLEPVVPMVRADHERWDGKGYPDGLKGEQIPLAARIVAIVDAYDAMVSDRVYRKAPGKEFAIQELKRCAGAQFDPHLVDVFLKILREV